MSVEALDFLMTKQKLNYEAAKPSAAHHCKAFLQQLADMNGEDEGVSTNKVYRNLRQREYQRKIAAR
eukprot:2549340-Ditylum_brightwellii.AAC.1